MVFRAGLTDAEAEPPGEGPTKQPAEQGPLAAEYVEAAVAAAPAATAPGPAQELIEWVRAKGGFVGGLSVRQYSATERGVVAAHNLPEDAVVLTLPAALLGTTQQAAVTPLGKALLEQVRGRHFDYIDLDGLLLAAWLLHESSNPGSPWAAYVASLPRWFPTMPWNFTEEAQRSCVEGLPAEAALTGGGHVLRREFEEIVQPLLAGDARYAATAWQRFLWARFVTFSRTFTVSRVRLRMDEYMLDAKHMLEVPQLDSGKFGGFRRHEKDDAYVLAPLADMLNHGRGDGVNCRWEYRQGGFSVLTKRPVATGEELHFSYAETKDNSVFLVYYGFVELGNPNDKANLTLHFGGGSEVPLIITGQPATVEDIIGVLGAARKHAAASAGVLLEVRPTRDLEASALRLLLQAIQHKAARYAAPPNCPEVCAAYRSNFLALIGTWTNFLARALAFISGDNGSSGGSTGGITTPRFLLHTRLYFGVWLRNGGDRFLVNEEALSEALTFGGVRYSDIMFEVGVI